MWDRNHHPRRSGLLVLALALLSSCKSGTGPGTGGTGAGGIAGSYQGVMVEGFEWGVLTITVSNVGSNPRAVGGWMILASANSSADSFPLAGTVDIVTDTLRLTSSRTPNLHVTGMISGDQIVGKAIGLGANGWLAMYAASGASVQTYCGYWNAFSPWYIVAQGTQLIGAAAGEGGDGGPLTGTLSGGSVALSFHGSYGTATGVVQDTTMHGNWHDNSNNNSGTWFSGTKRCP